MDKRSRGKRTEETPNLTSRRETRSTTRDRYHHHSAARSSSPTKSDRTSRSRTSSVSSRASTIDTKISTARSTRTSRQKTRTSPDTPRQTKDKLSKMHEEFCPYFEDGCFQGFRCQRIHDYSNVDLQQLAVMTDVMIGLQFENKKQIYKNATNIYLLGKKMNVSGLEPPLDYETSTTRDSRQIRRRSASLSSKLRIDLSKND